MMKRHNKQSRYCEGCCILQVGEGGRRAFSAPTSVPGRAARALTASSPFATLLATTCPPCGSCSLCSPFWVSANYPREFDVLTVAKVMWFSSDHFSEELCVYQQMICSRSEATVEALLISVAMCRMFGPVGLLSLIHKKIGLILICITEIRMRYSWNLMQRAIGP